MASQRQQLRNARKLAGALGNTPDPEPKPEPPVIPEPEPRVIVDAPSPDLQQVEDGDKITDLPGLQPPPLKPNDLPQTPLD